MTTKKIQTIEDLSVCTCPEPKSARVLSWSNKEAIHLCIECRGTYKRHPTETDYKEYFEKLLPPTLDNR